MLKKGIPTVVILSLVATLAAAVVFSNTATLTVQESVQVTAPTITDTFSPNETRTYTVFVENVSSVPVDVQLVISAVRFNGMPDLSGDVTLAGGTGAPFTLAPSGGSPTGFEVGLSIANDAAPGEYEVDISVVRP